MINDSAYNTVIQTDYYVEDDGKADAWHARIKVDPNDSGEYSCWLCRH